MERRRASGPGRAEQPSCALSSTRRAARLLTQLYDSFLSPHGIEAAQFALLMMIDAAPDKGQAAIAQALGMDKTTLSRNLKVLRAKGWVESEIAEDARRRSLRLSPAGARILAESRPTWKQAQEALHQEMSGPEWTELFGVMNSISRAANAVIRRREECVRS